MPPNSPTALSPTASLPAAWGLSLEEWRGVVAELGATAYRATQIWHGLHERLAGDWNEIANLPAALRQTLAARFDVAALTLAETRDSPDGTRKLLCTCRDGEQIEAVLIPAENRWTLCLSSQAGCAFGCVFCASGAAGLARNLEAGEIVGQAIVAARLLRGYEDGGSGGPALPSSIDALVGRGRCTRRCISVGDHRDPALRPSNIVVMGMGEPLANYDAVLKALRILNAPGGLSIGARHITVSTCGMVPGIRRLAEEGLQFELSVSLHAPDDALRSRLMPVNKRWPLDKLLPACRDYTAKTGRIVTFEYTLVAGLNDQLAHAQELARRLGGGKSRVNLIPLSPIKEFPGQPPDEGACHAFQRALMQAGLNVTLRRSRGGGVDAACGQLRLRVRTPRAGAS